MEALINSFFQSTNSIAISVAALVIYIVLFLYRNFNYSKKLIYKDQKNINSEELFSSVNEGLVQQELEIKAKKSDAASVSDRLKGSSSQLIAAIKGVFSLSSKISEDTLEELRYILISSDIGVKTTEKFLKELTTSLKKGEVVTEELLISKLKDLITLALEGSEPSLLENLNIQESNKPYIVLIVGVNGVGKTTTTAKLAARSKDRNLKVLMVAADTFRAAAVTQLKTWGERLNIEVISGAEDAKPQTVVFEAMKRAQDEKFDVILIDTAGRLNTKASLMQELTGIKNAIEKHFSNDALKEVLMVVDGTTGQNAVSQALEFHQAANLTGLVITKLDGTPKGGVVIAVKEATQVPVRYIGIGESKEDLRPFDAQEFVDALFAVDTKSMLSPSAHGEVRRRRRTEA